MDMQLMTVLVPLMAGWVASLKRISIIHWEMHWEGSQPCIVENWSALVMSAKLLSSHGAQDITKVMGY